MDELDLVFSTFGKIALFALITIFLFDYLFSSKFRTAWQLIKDSNTIFNRHPIFILPLLSVWTIYAVTVIYFVYFFNWDNLPTNWFWPLIFILIFIFSFLIAFSATIVLEMIQQLESGQKINIFVAVSEALRKDIKASLPLIIIWTCIWFILLILELMFTGKKEKDKEMHEFTAENVARTLSGETRMSSASEFFRLINKGLRMFVYLILPAIAWEDLGFFKAVEKGFKILNSYKLELLSSFILTDLAGLVIFLPPSIIIILSDAKVSFPTYVWVGVIVYGAFAWSYYLYLEQMVTALFYLWYLKWEKRAKECVASYQPIPDIQVIEKPSLLDEIYEFKK